MNATDKRFFWIALYAQPVLWILLAVLALVSLQFIWLTLVGKLDGLPRGCRKDGADMTQLLPWSLRSRIRLRSPGATSSVRRVAGRRTHYTGLVWREIWREVSLVACSGGDQRMKTMLRRRRALNAVRIGMAQGVTMLTYRSRIVSYGNELDLTRRSRHVLELVYCECVLLAVVSSCRPPNVTVVLASSGSIGEWSRNLFLVHQLVLELCWERPIGDEDLLAVLNQIAQLLLKIGTCLLFQASHLHIQRLLASTNRGLLELTTSC